MTPKNLITFIFLILLVLGTIFIWWPKYQDFTALQLKVETKKRELQSKEEYFSNLFQLSKKLKEEYGSEIAKIDLALPTDFSVFELLALLRMESSRNGLILGKFDIGSIPSLEGSRERLEMREIPINISLLGSYSAFKNFLSSLQKSARFFNIQSISFSPVKEEEKKEEGERETFNFNLTIKTYSY